MESKEHAWMSNLTDSQKETEQAIQEVRHTDLPLAETTGSKVTNVGIVAIGVCVGVVPWDCSLVSDPACQDHSLVLSLYQ